MRKLSLYTTIKLFVLGLLLAFYNLIPQQSTLQFKGQSDTYAQYQASGKALHLFDSAQLKKEFSNKTVFAFNSDSVEVVENYVTVAALVKHNVKANYTLLTYSNPRAPPIL